MLPVDLEGTFGYRNEGGCDGQQVQPKYSRRCSGILRLWGPNQPKVLFLGMVRNCSLVGSAKIELISTGVVVEEEGGRGNGREREGNVW